MDRSWSDDEIAILAGKVRSFAGCGPSDRLDVGKLIKRMQENPDRLARVTFIEASSSELSRSLARAEPKNRIVRYQPNLKNRAEAGDPVACQVLLEEIGHLLMHSSSPVLDHAIGVDLRAQNSEEVAQKEREAEKFVWYSMAPIDEVYAQTEPVLLMTRYGMSLNYAQKYLVHLRRTRNRIEKTSRPLPGVVLDFIEAAKSKGYPIKTKVESSYASVKQSGEPVDTPPIADTPPISVHKQEQFERGFLDETCPSCHFKKMRIVGGCKQCTCGENQGCD